MSLFFTYFSNKEAYIATDSRVSADINGKIYIIGDTQKYTILNDMIIIGGGEEHFCSIVLNIFQQFPVEFQDVDNLARTAKMIWHNRDKYIELWRIKGLSCDRVCEFRVTYYDRKENIIKHALIWDDNDYTPIIYTGEPRYRITVVGFNQDRAFEQLMSTNNSNVKEWFSEAYNAVSSECVGGTMTLLHMVKGNIISQETVPIVYSGKFNKDIIKYGMAEKELFLGNNQKNILTYIDGNGMTDTQLSKEDKNAIQGKYISCAGLNISGSDGSFNIDDNGRVTMDNCSITLNYTKEDQNNTIYIDAETGILFTNNGNEVVKLDIGNGNATFSGIVKAADIIGGTINGTYIDTDKDVSVGETLKIVNSDNGNFYFTISAGGITGDRICLQAANKRTIEIDGGAIYLQGNVYANSDRIATQKDIDDLQGQIDKLRAGL